MRVVRAVSLSWLSKVAKLRERNPGAARTVFISDHRSQLQSCFSELPNWAHRPELPEFPGSELLWSRAAGALLELPSGPELPGRFRIGFRAAISCSNLEYSKNGYTNRNFVLFASSLYYFIMMKCSRTSVLECDYTHKMERLHARKERLF